MYLWKCWRNTRVRFVVILILAATCQFQVHSQALVIDKFASTGISVIQDPARIEGYWQALADQIGLSFLFPCLFIMGFGSLSPGDEFAHGTADFLLTRPRSRRYFIWTSWLTGALEILTIALVYVSVIFVTAIWVTRTVYTWKLLAMVLPIFILGLVFYSPVCLMTALERSGRKGYGSGLGLMILYSLLIALFRARWGIHLPTPTALMRPFWNMVNGATGIHTWAAASQSVIAPMIGWSLFAVGCPLLAQLYIERTDV